MSKLPSSLPSGQEQPLPPGKALLVLLAVVVLLTAFVGLAYVLHISALYAGSLFLFYWLGIEKAAPTTYVPTVAGAFGGVAHAGLLHPAQASALGLDPGLAAVAGLLLLVLAIYLLLIHKLPALINQSYMLFLTVALIPQLNSPGLVADMGLGILYGAIFCGVAAFAARTFAARRLAGSAA